MRRLVFLLLTMSVCIVCKAGMSEHPEVSGSGMIKVSCDGDRVLWTLSSDLLGRSMSLFLTVMETDFEPSPDLKFGYGDDRFGPMVVRFRHEDDAVAFELALGPEEAFPGTSGWGVLKWLPIHDCEDSSEREEITLDVTELLQDDRIFGISSFAFHMRLGSFSFIKVKDIHADGPQMYVTTVSGYDAPVFPGLARKPSEWTVGACLTLLPEKPMPLRFRDSRVGYFTIPGARDGFQDRIIKRWRSGEVLFAIHPDFPRHLVPAVERAISNWERIFRKHSLPLTLKLTDPRNARYDDSRISWITFKESRKEDAYGRPYVDVRTGEILNCRITVFSGVFNLYRRWYVASTGKIGKMSDDIMETLFEMTMTHELGHVLGLEHNYYASSVFSSAQLRDGVHLHEKGFTSSVMDYVRINYVCDSPLPASDMIARTGPYDEAAVVWGYRFDESSSAEAFASEMFKDSLTRYFPQDGRDPDTMAEDVGNAPVECALAGMEKLRRACMLHTLSDTTAIRHDEFSKAVSVQYSHLLEHVLMCIGGVRRSVAPEGTVVYEPVPSDEQEDAVEFMRTYALACPEWLPSEIWEKASEGMSSRIEERLARRTGTPAPVSASGGRRHPVNPVVPPADPSSVDSKGYFSYFPDMTPIEMMAPAVFVRHESEKR